MRTKNASDVMSFEAIEGGGRGSVRGGAEGYDGGRMRFRGRWRDVRGKDRGVNCVRIFRI